MGATGGAAATIAGGEALAAAGSSTSLGTSLAVAATPLGVGLILAGFVAVGAEAEGTTNSSITWDCWKAIFHDTSSAPSQGRRLDEILSDGRVELVHKTDTNVLVKNMWGELFEITPVMLPSGQVAAHAAKV